MEAYQKEFISNLKKYRKEAGLSQAKLSELCNVSNGTIGNIECGSSKPSFDLILTLANVLDIHPAMLFSDKPAISDGAIIQNEDSQLDRKFLLTLYSELKEYLENK